MAWRGMAGHGISGMTNTEKHQVIRKPRIVVCHPSSQPTSHDGEKNARAAAKKNKN